MSGVIMRDRVQFSTTLPKKRAIRYLGNHAVIVFLDIDLMALHLQVIEVYVTGRNMLFCWPNQFLMLPPVSDH
jgi:hypothetical protein